MNLISQLLSDQPDLGEPIDWLGRVQRLDMAQHLRAAQADLRKRGHHLGGEAMGRYLRSIVLGEFLARWKEANAGTPFTKLEPEAAALLQRTVIAGADGQCFSRWIPRLARRKQLESLGHALGDESDFTGFVPEASEQIARKFLENFDAARPKAARAALRYMQKVAVSLFLHRRTRPIRTGERNLLAYLEHSPRLAWRTRVALKLAYLPFLMTARERKELVERYAWQPNLNAKLAIKEIAEHLGYKSPEALYRKLYKVRAWCRSHRAGERGLKRGARDAD